MVARPALGGHASVSCCADEQLSACFLCDFPFLSILYARKRLECEYRLRNGAERSRDRPKANDEVVCQHVRCAGDPRPDRCRLVVCPCICSVLQCACRIECTWVVSSIGLPLEPIHDTKIVKSCAVSSSSCTGPPPCPARTPVSMVCHMSRRKGQGARHVCHSQQAPEVLEIGLGSAREPLANRLVPIQTCSLCNVSGTNLASTRRGMPG